MKLDSSLFSPMSTSMSFWWHDSHCCVIYRLFSHYSLPLILRTSSTTRGTFGPQAKASDRHRPRAHLGTVALNFQQLQLHLPNFGIQIPPLCLHRHQQYPKPSTPPLPFLLSVLSVLISSLAWSSFCATSQKPALLRVHVLDGSFATPCGLVPDFSRRAAYSLTPATICSSPTQ